MIANDVDYNNSSVLIEVENNSERNFSLSLNINEDIRFHTEPYSTFQLSITVSVTEINGLPPANSASSTVYTQIMTRRHFSRLTFRAQCEPECDFRLHWIPVNRSVV